MKYLVSQLALTHRLSLGDYATLIGDDLLEAISQPCHFIIDRWVDDKDHFILSLVVQINLPTFSIFEF